MVDTGFIYSDLIKTNFSSESLMVIEDINLVFLATFHRNAASGVSILSYRPWNPCGQGQGHGYTHQYEAEYVTVMSCPHLPF